MKIGDYVRTPYGIARIKNIFCETGYVFIETDNEIGDCSMINKGVLRKGIIVMENDYANFRKNNVKENPIDLIQKGDYINGLRVEKNKYGELYTCYVYFGGDIGRQCELYDTWLKEYKEDEDLIDTIVTKEQFESMEYKIGE